MFIKKKSLSQNFIHDKDLNDRIADKLGDVSSTNIIEIGPGIGTLTKSILQKKPKTLTVIEKDTRLKGTLESDEEIAGADVKIIFGDALFIREGDLVNKPVKMISNLPFKISSQLLFKWVKEHDFFESITVMLQKELAERIVAKRGSNYGRTSVILQAFFKIDNHFDVKAKFFDPVPKVDASVITLKPIAREKISFDQDLFFALTRALFMHKRKMIGKGLSNFISDLGIQDQYARQKVLQSIGIDESYRPENILPEQYIEITNLIAFFLKKSKHI